MLSATVFHIVHACRWTKSGPNHFKGQLWPCDLHTICIQHQHLVVTGHTVQQMGSAGTIFSFFISIKSRFSRNNWQLINGHKQKMAGPPLIIDLRPSRKIKNSSLPRTQDTPRIPKWLIVYGECAVYFSVEPYTVYTLFIHHQHRYNYCNTSAGPN